MTHRCDYCGSLFSLQSDDDMILCECCGEARMYNIKEARISVHYQTVGHEVVPPPADEEEEPAKKKGKKKSKDLKAKKTSLSYAESVRQRYDYKLPRGN